MTKVYHTFESKNGFDLNKIDFDRGIFTVKPWWVGKAEYKEYSAFHPNEFGDKVVELEIDDNAKTFTTENQIDFIEDEFRGKESTKKLIDKFEMGTFEKDDWQKLDTFIGQFVKKQGYKIIHYTGDEMYGDVWVILDKSVIKNYRFENEPETEMKEDTVKNIKLKSLVPEEFQQEPTAVDGMNKRKAINYITKTFKVYEKLRGFFADDSWEPINGIIGDLQQGDIPIQIMDTDYYKDHNQNPSGKIWTCEIAFINQNGRPDTLHVSITAAGAGSVKDPLDRYDVTFVIN